MKNKLLLSSMALIAITITGCGLTNSSSSSSASSSSSVSVSQTGSSSSSQGGVTYQNVKTGDAAIEITGSNVSVKTGDESCVAIIQQQDKAFVYPLHAGTVLLTNGADEFGLNISYDIVIFGEGNDYLNAISETRRADFRGDKEVSYVVGNKNPVKLDMVFEYNTWLEDTDGTYYDDVVNVEISEAVYDENNETFEFTFSSSDVELTETNLEDYVILNDDLTLSFTDEALEKEFTVTVANGENSASQTFVVNNGYNAYDNDSFKLYFEDNSVTTINVLRSFDAVLAEDQYYFNEMVQKNVPFNTTKDTNAHIWQGSVYYRYYTAENFNPLVVNGNYMHIEGNELPLHVPFNNLDQNGQAVDYSNLDKVVNGKTYKFATDGFTQAGALGGIDQSTITKDNINDQVVNVQEGIFRIFYNGKLTEETNIDQVTLKNLSVRGNSAQASEDGTILHSGGFIGMMNNGGIVKLENTNLTFLVSGAQTNYNRGKMVVKDSNVNDIWGPGLSTWRGNMLSVENSYITRAGGPALWNIGEITDSNKLTVSVDESSVIDNYLTPTSEWFNAYNINGIANYTSSIEALLTNTNVPGTPSTKYSIFDESGTKFNFVSLIQSTSETDSNNKPGGTFTIKGTTGEINPARYTDGTIDSKATVSGQIFSSMGMVSGLGQDIDAQLNSAETQTLIANFVQALMGQGMDQANATTTAVQMALVYYLQNYVDSLTTDSKYIVVDVYFPGFGLLSAIIEVKAKA